MRLVNIEIDNFRTLKDFRLEDLGSLHVVTGMNNSGKTNFLRALDLFFNHIVDGTSYDRRRDMPHHIVFGTRSGSAKTQITITLCFSADEIINILQYKYKSFERDYLKKETGEYFLKIKKVFHETKSKRNIDIIIYDNSNNQHNMELNSELNRIIKIIFDRIRYFYLPSNFDVNDLIRDLLIEEILSLSLEMFGKTREHQGKVLKTRESFTQFIEQTNALLKESSEELTGFLQDILKATPKLTADIPLENWKARIELPKESKIIDAIKSTTIFWLEDGTRNISIESKGSGLQKTTAIILMEYILTAIKSMGRSTKPLFIWGIDEPEMNLQPSLQKTIYQRLKKLAQEQQIILATHSPHFVDLYESSQDVSLFDLSAELVEIREKSFHMKKTVVLNEKNQKSDFYKSVKEHLGISLFDTWHFMKTNYLFEGGSDEHYVLSMYNYLTGKSLRGSTLYSGGASNIIPYTRLIDNIAKDSRENVSLVIILDYDHEGKPIKDKMETRKYSNLDINIIYTGSAYFSTIDNNFNTEMEDMAIPEIYWMAICKFLEIEKNISHEKIPLFEEFTETRKKFNTDKMTDFLDSWLYIKLERTIDKGLMKQDYVKRFISITYSDMISRLSQEEKNDYIGKYPTILEFLQNL